MFCHPEQSVKEEDFMQAIAVITPGGPDVLRLTHVPEPTPTPGQIMVRGLF